MRIVEGDSVTEPKRHLEYRFVAPLVRVSVWVTYDWWQPKPLPGQNAKRVVKNLATHRWHGPPLGPDEEIDAVRRVQTREKLAFDKLLAGGAH